MTLNPEKAGKIVKFRHPSNAENLIGSLRRARNRVSQELDISYKGPVETTNIRTSAPSRPIGTIYLIRNGRYSDTELGYKVHSLNQAGFFVKEIGVRRHRNEDSPA